MLQPVLEMNNLSISFNQYVKGFKRQTVDKVKNINLKAYPGEVLAIIGASGSGKSLVSHAVFGVLPKNAIIKGDIFFKGNPLTNDYLKKVRGKEIAYVPQTIDALDPLLKAGKQVIFSIKEENKKEKLREVFQYYNLPNRAIEMYPFQLSGGMARRILASTALLTDAELIIADEPTPGMDQNAIEQTLSMMETLKGKNTAIIVIIHDIKTAIKIADRIAILKDGTIIETAPVDSFRGKGEHLETAFARNLWRALPENGFYLPSLKDNK